MQDSCNPLQNLRVNNPLRIIVKQLNISFIRIKFDGLCSIFKEQIHVSNYLNTFYLKSIV